MARLPVPPAYQLPGTYPSDEWMPLASAYSTPERSEYIEAAREEDLDNGAIRAQEVARALGRGSWLTAMTPRWPARAN